MSMVIDIHAHVVLEESLGTAGEYGPELSQDGNVQDFRVGDYVMRVPYRGSVFMDAQKRVDAMDVGSRFTVTVTKPAIILWEYQCWRRFSVCESIKRCDGSTY